jgi:hypothetical protein
MHLMTDDVVGVFVIASPWLFAFTAVLALRSTPNSATVSCSSVDATISKSGEFRFGLIGVRNHGDRDPDQRSNRQASRRVALSKSWTDYSVAVNTPVYAARL